MAQPVYSPGDRVTKVSSLGWLNMVKQQLTLIQYYPLVI